MNDLASLTDWLSMMCTSYPTFRYIIFGASAVTRVWMFLRVYRKKQQSCQNAAPHNCRHMPSITFVDGAPMGFKTIPLQFLILIFPKEIQHVSITWSCKSIAIRKSWSANHQIYNLHCRKCIGLSFKKIPINATFLIELVPFVVRKILGQNLSVNSAHRG